MVVAYVIGSILIAFGIAILHKIFSGSSTGLQNVYYPFTGILLLIIGAWVCYGYMAAGSACLTPTPPLHRNPFFKFSAK